MRHHPRDRFDGHEDHQRRVGKTATVIGIGMAVLGLGALLVLRGPSPAARKPTPEPPGTSGPVVAASPPGAPSDGPTPPVTKPAAEAHAAEHTPGLLPNASFEVMQDDRPAEWSVQFFAGDGKVSCDSVARDGARSLRISATSEGVDGVCWTRIAVKPHTAYRLEGWIRTESVAGAKGALLTVFQTSFRSQAVSGTTDWSPVSLEFTTGDAVVVRLNCVLGGWGKATGTA